MLLTNLLLTADKLVDVKEIVLTMNRVSGSALSL